MYSRTLKVSVPVMFVNLLAKYTHHIIQATTYKPVPIQSQPVALHKDYTFILLGN
jgi:hypothetical protein